MVPASLDSPPEQSRNLRRRGHPTTNRSVFSRGAQEVWIANADGSGLTRLPYDGRFPSWHPDGTRILVCLNSPPRLLDFVVNGSSVNVIPLPSQVIFTFGGTRLVNAVTQARWSPDGRRIAVMFDVQEDPSTSVDEVHLFDANGVDLGNVVAWQGEAASWPSWSPDGSKIALWGGYVTSNRLWFGTGYVPAEGGPKVGVVEGYPWGIDWSPDGSSLITALRVPGAGLHLYNTDLATQVTTLQIPAGPGYDYEPSWMR